MFCIILILKKTVLVCGDCSVWSLVRGELSGIIDPVNGRPFYRRTLAVAEGVFEPGIVAAEEARGVIAVPASNRHLG